VRACVRERESFRKSARECASEGRESKRTKRASEGERG
jgi:hypothetical protein